MKNTNTLSMLTLISSLLIAMPATTIASAELTITKNESLTEKAKNYAKKVKNHIMKNKKVYLTGALTAAILCSGGLYLNLKKDSKDNNLQVNDPIIEKNENEDTETLGEKAAKLAFSGLKFVGLYDKASDPIPTLPNKIGRTIDSCINWKNVLSQTGKELWKDTKNASSDIVGSTKDKFDNICNSEIGKSISNYFENSKTTTEISDPEALIEITLN